MTISRYVLDISYDTGLSALLDEFDPFPERAVQTPEEPMPNAFEPETKPAELKALSPAGARRAGQSGRRTVAGTTKTPTKSGALPRS
jgi:hypothetical protein